MATQVSADASGEFFDPLTLSMPERLARLGNNWGWFLALGLFSLLFGMLAFGWPVTSSAGLTFALGVLFVANGVLHLIQAFQLRKETGTGWRLVMSVTALAAGVLMLKYPAAGMFGVAIAMAFYFFMSATTKSIAAFGMKGHRGWGWVLASAIASFILGIYIIATFPVSALWVPGTVLGIDFIVHGASMIGLSFDLKKIHQRLTTAAGMIGAGV